MNRILSRIAILVFFAVSFALLPAQSRAADSTAASPWIGVYKSKTSIMPAELVEAARKKGQDVEDSYPTVHLYDNGTIETRMFGKVETSGQFEVRGKTLVVTFINPKTGKKQVDAQNSFSSNYKELTLGTGALAMEFVKK